jgi:hypothetical protein
LDGNTRNALNRGISYLAENWNSIDASTDPHTLALVTYALHLAQHPQKDQVRSRSYVSGIYNYSASAVVCRLERFSKQKKIFLFQNAIGYSWRCKFLQRWRRNSKS